MKLMVINTTDSTKMNLEVDYYNVHEIECGKLKGTNYIVTEIINHAIFYVLDEEEYFKRYFIIKSDYETLKELEMKLSNIGYKLIKI